MNRPLLFLLSTLCSAPLSADPRQGSLERLLEGLLAEPALKTASLGFALIPLDDPEPAPSEPEEQGEDNPAEETEESKTSAESEDQETPPLRASIFHNPDLALTPASVQKAITTATALQVLGPDYRFQTRIYRAGEDLIIRGGGDPLLASTSVNAEFSAWHEALLEAGLKEITGTLIADSSFFEGRTTPNQWLWGDIGNYYGAGPSGLNFHRNSYTITFRPGEVGAPARLLSTFPKPPGVTFDNHMITGPSGSGDQGYAYSGPRRELVTLRGTVPAGGQFTIRGALPNPPLSCLTAFRDFLRKEDFTVNAIAVRQAVLAEEDLIHTTESPTLAKLIIPTNMRSVNLNADCLFKALTPAGTTRAAQEKLRSHWTTQGVDLDGFLTHDGSGLSPQNLLTARQTAQILKLISNSEHGALFRASLPVSGRSGTLRSFGRGTATEGRLVAKTGSMERVRTWAGYLRTQSGERYAFALFINHYHETDSSIRRAAGRFLAGLCEQ